MPQEYLVGAALVSSSGGRRRPTLPDGRYSRAPPSVGGADSLGARAGSPGPRSRSRLEGVLSRNRSWRRCSRVHEGYVPPTVSIYGPPGTGKTLSTRCVCREFATRHGDVAVEDVTPEECPNPEEAPLSFRKDELEAIMAAVQSVRRSIVDSLLGPGVQRVIHSQFYSSADSAQNEGKKRHRFAESILCSQQSSSNTSSIVRYTAARYTARIGQEMNPWDEPREPPSDPKVSVTGSHHRRR